MKRKGAAKGKGRGYKNLPTHPKDPKVHSMSAKGMKQPQRMNEFSQLNIVPVYVPRGSGNNPVGGKLDLHYKIQKWGYVFPTKEAAQKYADEYIEINGQIIEKKKLKDSDGDEALKKEYKQLLDKDIQDYSIGLENRKTKERMAEIEKYFEKKEKDTDGDGVPDFVYEDKLTEQQILLLKRRLNDGKLKPGDIFPDMIEKRFRLSPQQTEKGLKYLKNIWKGKSGAERKNSPFGGRETSVLENFDRFELVNFENVATFNQRDMGINYYLPVYKAIGKDGSSFTYRQDASEPSGIRITG